MGGWQISVIRRDKAASQKVSFAGALLDLEQVPMSAKKKIDPEKEGTLTKKINSIDFKVLDAFVAVQEAGGFRLAADKLNITQPMVTARIDQLEELLGIHLFERDGHDRRLSTLTPKGREGLVYAKRLIHLRSEMREAFRDPSAVRGIIRLGVSESVAHTRLPTLIKRVAETYPNLRPEIEVDISPKLLDGLVTRDLHLALLLKPIDNENVRWRQLCEFKVGFIASEEIKFSRKSIALEDIVKHRIITFARHTQPYLELRKMLDRAELDATIWASASLETVVRLALDGNGVAVIPPDIIAKRVDARKKLRELNTKIKLPNLDYAVGWPATLNDVDDSTVRKVVDIAIEVAKEWSRVKID
jgi:DNA-binding transcriptional LysR family regulator